MQHMCTVVMLSQRTVWTKVNGQAHAGYAKVYIHFTSGLFAVEKRACVDWRSPFVAASREDLEQC